MWCYDNLTKPLLNNYSFVHLHCLLH
uniref:Uncharacterized protein n=1 Tax=Anguilla anguilla TaxID=7936 RepID=A0A0E9T114_ANGAN